MSTYADSSKARVWEDGDAFRAPAGTTLPTDIFAPSLPGWDAFGGIRAGFTVTKDQTITPLDIWNNKSGAAYKNKKEPVKPTIALEPVDYSKATILTLLRGGSIVAGAGGFEHIDGDDEEFALIVRVYDGTEQKAYYIERGELGAIPEEKMDGTDIEGFPLSVTPLAPASGGDAVRKFTKTNPLA
ncbi:hypothetical protein ACQPXB_35875 [Amycolatopsis sp. CA-161197]|uniref:phage tail tube protein n=1 Tax=Amycolatopsis sp. CA-161197 TaxID=3239922 RepID=UPI003D8C24E3